MAMKNPVTGLIELADQIVIEAATEGSSVSILHEVMERAENAEYLATTLEGATPTAAQIYDSFVYGGNSALGEQLGQNFELVAMPNEMLESGIIALGDIRLRRIEGEGTHVSFIASPELKSLQDIQAEGLAAESHTSGNYAQVVDAGAFPHNSNDKFERQMTDSAGRLLNDILILRLATPPTSTVVNLQQSPAAAATPEFQVGRLIPSTPSEANESVLATASREMSLQAIANGTQGKLPSDVLAAILTRGESNANELANQVFWQRHPDLAGTKLDSKSRAQQALRTEWSVIYRLGVKPMIWLRALIDQLDKHRETIPRDFLLGWIAVESDGYLRSTTALGELGYFQIMWQGGEAQSQLGLTLDEFKSLNKDPEFSIEKGVALAAAYRRHILKTYPSVPDGSELLWRLTKARHAASGILKNALSGLLNSSMPITWTAVATRLPPWMRENLDHTLNYAAKLKALAAFVPDPTGATEVFTEARSVQSSIVAAETEATSRLVLDIESGELQPEDSGSCATPVEDVIYGWGQYKDEVDKLPQSEKDKIARLADIVVTSFSAPNCSPLGQISVVGHADRDVHGAALEKKVSNERAISVAAELAKAIMNLWKARSMGPFRKGAIAFDPSPHGVGATIPDPANVPIVTSRERNRRVAIAIRPLGSPNPAPPSPLPPKPSTPPGPPPNARTCCILAPSDNPLGPADDNFADPTKLGIHRSSSEVRGLVYTGKAGFVDLGHLRDLCDMTKNVFEQIAFAAGAAGTVIKTTHGEATLSTIPASVSVISIARSICFDDSFGYEILTYAINSPGVHNSSFSPEDLPSNFLGTLVAERAIAAGGNFDAAVTAEIYALLRSLGSQTKAESFRAFNLVNHRWVDYSGVRSLLSNDYLKRRNFTREPWKTGHPSDSPTPAFAVAGFGLSGPFPYSYVHTAGRRFAKTDYPSEVATIRADALRRYGVDFDKP